MSWIDENPPPMLVTGVELTAGLGVYVLRFVNGYGAVIVMPLEAWTWEEAVKEVFSCLHAPDMYRGSIVSKLKQGMDSDGNIEASEVRHNHADL